MGAIGTVGVAVSVLPESTWAARPSAVGRTRQRIKITDFGPTGTWFVSNGTRWYPESGEVVVGGSKTDITTAVLDTASNFVAGVTIPAGLIAAGCEIHVDRVWAVLGTGTKSEKMYLSTTTSTLGTAFSAGQQFSTNSLNASASTSAQTKNIIHVSDSSANSQFSLGAGASSITPFANVTNAATTGTIETQSAACYINLCMAKGTAADSVILKSHKVAIKF